MNVCQHYQYSMPIYDYTARDEFDVCIQGSSFWLNGDEIIDIKMDISNSHLEIFYTSSLESREYNLLMLNCGNEIPPKYKFFKVLEWNGIDYYLFIKKYLTPTEELIENREERLNYILKKQINEDE